MGIEKRHFNGMDQDTTDRMLPSGSYRYALNCHVATSDGSDMGAVENVRGNQLITFALPPGDNKCIGTYEDRVNDSLIFFVWNSAADHSIFRFFPVDLTIKTVMTTGFFKFQRDALISGVALEGDLLYFTEGTTPQRKINIEKARHDKFLQVNLYVEVGGSPLESYNLLIIDSSGLTLENGIVYTIPGPFSPSLDEMVANITNGINGLGGAPTNFIAEDMGTFVRLTMKVQGYFDVSLTGLNTVAMAVYENMYQLPIRESYIDMIKAPPLFPPSSEFVQNASNRTLNDTKGKTFEFRARYVYDDHEKSVLSPISKLPRGNSIYGPGQTYNLIVDYGNKRLRDRAELCIIHKLDLFVREENSGVWKIVKSIDRSEMVSTGNTFRFLNNEEYSAISENESDKPFDALPLLSNALEIMSNFLFLDAKKEGFDTIPVDIELQLRVNDEIPFLGLTDRGMFLKRPGFYKWGLVYMDRANRSTTSLANQQTELLIPAYADELAQYEYVINNAGKRFGTVELKWKIKHLPPIEATHYAWVRTKDSIHNDYLQTKISAIRYLAKDKSTAVGYGNAQTHYLEVSFSGWDDVNDDFPNADYGWAFKEGDKIRFLKDETDSFLTTKHEADIVEGVAGFKFLILTSDITIQIKTGFLVEFYAPGKDVENSIFYEIGEFYEIGNPHLPNRYHKGQIFDQDPNNPIFVPAEGIFLEGDNHRIASSEGDFVVDSVQASQTEKAFLNSYNIGRPNIFSSEVGSAERGHTIRVSNKRFLGTNINGHSTFNAIDAYDLQKSYGDIQRLVQVDNVMLSIHTREAISLYIQENIYTDLSGQSTVTISDKIIGNDRVLKGRFGTDNPESFVVQDSRAYWFCTNKGQYVRYGGDGLTPISKYFMRRFFKRKGAEINQYGGNVFSSYDEDHGKLMVAFSKVSYLENDNEVIVSEAETLAFDEDNNRWTSFFSYHPENMEKLNTQLISFKDGALWLHNANPVHNHFYGVQYTSQIQPVFNQEQSQEKVYQSMSVEATDLWLPVELTTPEGQKSSLITVDFERLENIFYASILCDENTPNVSHAITQGDVMRSSVLRVLLENNNTNKSILYFANVESVGSFLSNS